MSENEDRIRSLESRINELEQNAVQYNRAKTDLENLFTLSLDIVCIINCSTAVFIRVNPAFRSVLGYSESESLGLSFLEIVHPEDLDAANEMFSSGLSNGNQVINFITRCRAKDGSYRCLEWNAHPDPAHGVAYSVARDISARRGNDDSSRLAEETLRAMLNAVQESAFLINRNGIILEHNRTFAERLRSPRLDLRGENYYEQISKELRDYKKQRFDDVFKLGLPVQFEARGQERDLFTTGYPVFDSNGRVTKVAVFSHDITELREAQRLILGNGERLSSLLRLSQMLESSETDIKQAALDEAVRISGSEVGYFHMINEEVGTIELVLWSTETMKKCAASKLLHYPIEQAGIWADSVRLRRPVLHNDYRSAEGRKGYPQGHFPIIRHMSVPIFDNDEIVAVAGVGNKKTPYDDDDAAQFMLYMSSVWAIIKQKRADAILKRYSAEDALTGLANRRRFNEVFETEWRRAVREKLSIAVIFSDIDCFKNYNDLYGHQAGDECLRRVSDCLKMEARRPGDIVARYGGEEFIAVLPGSNLVGAINVAEHMRICVSDLKLEHSDSTAAEYVTISLGVASCIPTEDMQRTELLTLADNALYKAKKEGRNAVRYAG